MANEDSPGTVKARRQERQRQKDERAEERRKAISAHLDRLGLSQKQACDMAGLENASALGNFLAGRSRSLNLETLEPLARALNLTIGEIIGEEPLSPKGTQRVIVERGGLRVTVETNEPADLLRSLFGNEEPGKKRA